ncbi:MAG: ATP synthase F1 subunit delta [Planctomycetota bacterium]|nr:MAG: ATP synthase F1 subunit delta [Planctomycetota bacterium]
MSVPASVPAVYAHALLDLADEAGERPQVMEEVQALRTICAPGGALMAGLQGGSLSRQHAKDMVRACFADRLSPLLQNFLSLLADRDRLLALPAILDATIQEHEHRSGIVRVQAVTAVPADDASRDRITQALAQRLGAQVDVQWQTDESLVAGMRLRYGDTLVDASARRRLTDAHAAICAAPLAVIELDEGDVA